MLRNRSYSETPSGGEYAVDLPPRRQTLATLTLPQISVTVHEVPAMDRERLSDASPCPSFASTSTSPTRMPLTLSPIEDDNAVANHFGNTYPAPKTMRRTRSIDAVVKILSDHFASEPMSRSSTDQSKKSTATESAWPDDASVTDTVEGEADELTGKQSNEIQASCSDSVIDLPDTYVGKQVDQHLLTLTQDDEKLDKQSDEYSRQDGDKSCSPLSSFASPRGRSIKSFQSTSASMMTMSDGRSFSTENTATVSTPSTEIFDFGFDAPKEESGMRRPRHTDIIILDDEDMKLERGTSYDVSTRGLERLSQWRRPSAVDRLWRSDFTSSASRGSLPALYEDGNSLARIPTAASRFSSGSGNDGRDDVVRVSWSRKHNESTINPAEGKVKLKKAAGRGRVVPIRVDENGKPIRRTSVSTSISTTSGRTSFSTTSGTDYNGNDRRPSMALSTSSGSTTMSKGETRVSWSHKHGAERVQIGKGRMVRGPGRGRTIFVPAEGSSPNALPSIVHASLPAIPDQDDHLPTSAQSMRKEEKCEATAQRAQEDMPRPNVSPTIAVSPKSMSSSISSLPAHPPPLRRMSTSNSVSTVASTISVGTSSPAASMLLKSKPSKKSLAALARKTFTATAPASSSSLDLTSANGGHHTAQPPAKPAKMKSLGRGRMVIVTPKEKTSKKTAKKAAT